MDGCRNGKLVEEGREIEKDGTRNLEKAMTARIECRIEEGGDGATLRADENQKYRGSRRRQDGRGRETGMQIGGRR